MPRDVYYEITHKAKTVSISSVYYKSWQYHQFNLSLRGVQEQLAYRGISVSHETVRNWCLKFSRQFKDVLQRQERRVSDNGTWMR